MEIKAARQIRVPALILLAGIVGGLVVSQHLQVGPFWLLGASLFFVLVSLYLARLDDRRSLWWFCFMIAAFNAFWAYGEMRFPVVPEASILKLPQREAELTFSVKNVFRGGGRFGNTNVLAKVQTASVESRLEPGMLIYASLRVGDEQDFQVEQGQLLRAFGVLRPISEPFGESNDFYAYLKSAGAHYLFQRTWDMELLRPASAFNQFCSSMNERFQGILRLGEPEFSEVGNVYVAMLLGRKVELSQEQGERFRKSGTMHFFAISGLHIGVIAVVIAQFLFLIRVPRMLAPLIGLSLLYLYVEITGGAPSAVRAFLMTAFFWASFAVQRQRQPLGALVASAVFVLVIAPSNLWSVGFQLSYSVVFSILLFGLPLYEQLGRRFQLFSWLPKSDWRPFQHAIVWGLDKVYLLFGISLSAWLASSLLSAGYFGFFAPGAIFLNMLLVYLASISIITGVISMALGLIGLSAVSAFINHAAWLAISGMDFLVGISLQVPGAVVLCEEFPLTLSYLGLLAYFAALFAVHFGGERPKMQLLWLPFLVVILFLGLGFYSN